MWIIIAVIVVAIVLIVVFLWPDPYAVPRVDYSESDSLKLQNEADVLKTQVDWDGKPIDWR